MNRNAERDEVECLSPGALMALIDEELEQAEREAALSHLDKCSRCRELSEGLRAAARVVQATAQCLDGEGVAAWIDFKAGRTKGALGRDEIGRIREHLSGCGRCRSQVAMLVEACRSSESVWERLRESSRRVIGSWRAQPVPTLRWAAVTAVGVVAIGAAYVFLTWSERPSYRPEALVRAEGGRGGLEAPRPEGPVVAQRPVGEAPPNDGAREAAGERPQERGPAVAVAQRTPGEQERPTTAAPQAALVPETGEADDDRLRAALAELEDARRSGDAGAQARAALGAAGILHNAQRYREASACYREAAEAAARADEAELRVDALVLLGAVLAELGETEQARGELQAAAALAGEAGYERGERNARVQMRLLPAAEAGNGR